ncbi:RimK family alpha-L-glutamate ligase [Bacteroidota bacterium]
MNAVILNSNPKSSATRSLIRAGNKLGANSTVLDPAFLSPMVSNIEGRDRLYDTLAGSHKRLAASGIDIVIPRMTNIYYNTFVLEHLVYNKKIPSIQSPQGIRIAANKWHTIQVCSRNGIRTPKTVYSKSMKDIDYLIAKLGPLPLVLKYNYGSLGKSVMILDSKRNAISTIQSLIQKKQDFIIQEYIDGGSKDIRVIVIGSKVIAAYQRIASQGEWRSNIHLGAKGMPVTLSPEEEIMSIKAASAIDLEVAGIDLMRNPDNIPYLIEINSSPGFFGSKVTGINFAEQIMKYAIQKANSKQTPMVERGKLPEGVYKKHFAMLNNQLKYFTQNPEILSSYDNAKGKKLKYIDSKGNRQVKLIETPKDLYDVIFKTFKVG